MNKLLLSALFAAAAVVPALKAADSLALVRPIAVPAAAPLSKLDNDLVDDIERRSFRYFMEQTDLRTGLVMDRALARPTDQDPSPRNVASIAATGFGLTAFCIAVDHRWIGPETAKARVLPALRFFAEEAAQQHGWFYHFMDASTGERAWKSEISSIDTALLLAGVLSVRQCFNDDPEVVRLSTAIYNRVDFPWMLDAKGQFFMHGWKPESGFIRYRWDTYSELLILYALGIGSPTHPVSPDTWDAWNLPVTSVGQYTYIGGGPLFVHQYSQAWLDLRGQSPGDYTTSAKTISLNTFDPRATRMHPDYFANSVAATRAQQEIFSKILSQKYPSYSNNLWGVTASESSKGYTAWGASADDPRIDGSIVPSAAGGSLMFAPDICIPALRTMLVQYGDKIYNRYGFTDAFNPATGWISKYVLGIDVGITLLSAENLRSGSVWRWFMNNPEPVRALDLAGIGSYDSFPVGQIRIVASEPIAAPASVVELPKDAPSVTPAKSRETQGGTPSVATLRVR